MIFKTKQCTVEAMQYNRGDDYLRIVAWIRSHTNDGSFNNLLFHTKKHVTMSSSGHQTIAHQEYLTWMGPTDVEEVYVGDWIIRTMRGSFRVCRKRDFDEIFEEES